MNIINVMSTIDVIIVQIIFFIVGILLGRLLSNRKNKRVSTEKEFMWSRVFADIDKLYSILRGNREEIIMLKRRISKLEDRNYITEVELVEE